MSFFLPLSHHSYFFSIRIIGDGRGSGLSMPSSTSTTSPCCLNALQVGVSDLVDLEDDLEENIVANIQMRFKKGHIYVSSNCQTLSH